MTELRASKTLALPTARRTRRQLLSGWLIGLVFFGYAPSLTFGAVAWLLNEQQWFWSYLMYVTEVPLIGGFFVLWLPWRWYQSMHRVLQAWERGEPVDSAQCLDVYTRALGLPWRVAVSAFAAALIGYVIGVSVVHWRAQQPWSEYFKTLPGVPLVGGLMGAYCYFSTVRALHPVVAWCSLQLRHPHPVRRISLASKFLMTTCVLAVAALCLLQPAAYTLGQVVNEGHLQERTLTALRAAALQAGDLLRPAHRLAQYQEAALGAHGYVLVIDAQGRLLTPHPKGYTTISQEALLRLARHTQGSQGAWVDRVGRHRVVAYVRPAEDPWLILSLSFPSDFAIPLRHFMQFSWLVILQIFFVVIVMGRYFTKGITTPLDELTQAARQIAERGDLSQFVPVTTNDELGEVARAFNHMVARLQASQQRVAEYTQRLECSTQELSALNQEMEDLLRVVSHDLRAPLINIQGFSKRIEPAMHNALALLEQSAQAIPPGPLHEQLCAAQETSGRRFTESQRFIGKGIEKMDALLSSLLAVSRVGRKADPIRPHDLDGILDDVLAAFDHQLKEAAIQVIRHPLPAGVPCRRNEINQVFSNLLANALRYMGPTGQRCIEIGGTVKAGEAECFVRDTGIGIDPADHEQIFHMFTRLHQVDVAGEGVGLAYVRKIVRSHSGRIEVASQRGQGSTFTFALPLAHAAG
jgi:signal transduction histidine kinase